MGEARRVLHEHEQRGLDDDARRAASTIVDFDADEADCPACGTRFSTTTTRCPECGLNFGG